MKLIDINCSLDGVGFLGECTSLTPPKVVEQSAEVNAGGLGGAVNVPLGRVEKMQAVFVMNSFNGEPEKVFAQDNVALTFRCLAVDNTGKNNSVTFKMRGRMVQLDNGELSPGKLSSFTGTMDVSKVTKLVAGEEVLHVDIPGRILRRNGQDVWADARRILGL